MSRSVGNYASTLTEGIAERAYQRLRRSRPWVQFPENLVPAPGQSKWDAYSKVRDIGRTYNPAVDVKQPHPTKIPRPSTNRAPAAPAAPSRSPSSSPDVWLELVASEARESRLPRKAPVSKVTPAPERVVRPSASATPAQPEPKPLKSALRTANTSRNLSTKNVQWGSTLETTVRFFKSERVKSASQDSANDKWATLHARQAKVERVEALVATYKDARQARLERAEAMAATPKAARKPTNFLRPRRRRQPKSILRQPNTGARLPAKKVSFDTEPARVEYTERWIGQEQVS